MEARWSVRPHAGSNRFLSCHPPIFCFLPTLPASLPSAFSPFSAVFVRTFTPVLSLPGLSSALTVRICPYRHGMREMVVLLHSSSRMQRARVFGKPITDTSMVSSLVEIS